MTIHELSLYDGANFYVEGMTDHQSLDPNLQGLVVLNGCVADGTADLMASTAVVASTTYTLTNPILLDGPFGRVVSVTSDDAGDITITGRDYLGQVMTETITCIVGAAEGAKAFKYIDSYTASSGLAGNISFGSGGEFGLPFMTSEIIDEYADGVLIGAGANHVVPDTATPTATTGDVRGTVDPTTAPDGTKVIQMTVRFNNLGTGGLYGQKQA